MYISKLILPAILALRGLAVAQGLAEGEAPPDKAAVEAREPTEFLPEDHQDGLDKRSFWRCRRILPRPGCPGSKEPFCSRSWRNQRDWVKYDGEHPWCRNCDGHSTFCA
ncbi:hypothetical protein F4808DRAFT_414697 [Astrocystis sublimbata]|nr:hypothetical protein F4808DRAFT_414697 [Astrocystis sublimbata]